MRRFCDLPVYDGMEPYADWITVEQAYADGFIPEMYREFCPTHCQCGSERIVRTDNNGTVTAITCCDFNCYFKVGAQLNDVVKNTGVKGLGPAACTSLAMYYYMIDPDICSVGNIIAGTTKELYGRAKHNLYGNPEFIWEQFLKTFKTYNDSFGKLLVMLSYNNLGTRVADALKGFDSVEEIIQFQDSGQKLVQRLNEQGVYAMNVVWMLYNSLDDVNLIIKAFDIKCANSNLPTVNVCLSGTLYVETSEGNPVRYTKKDLMVLLNKLASVDGVQKARFEETTLPKAKFLITMETHSKAVQAKKRGIPCYTPTEVVASLVRRYRKEEREGQDADI